MDKLADLPDDIDALKAIIAEHQSELAFQELMIAKLKAQLDKQLRHRFGASSESLDQLQLTLEGLEITRSAVTPDALPEPAETLKLKPIRKPLPDHLPRREQILDVGDACTQCGGTLKPIGEDVTEELDYVPRRFVVNKIIRPRMTCRCCDRFQQAPHAITANRARTAKHPSQHLHDYTGFMHADGYTGYEELYRTGRVTEVACLAHIRRKFVDQAKSTKAKIATEAVERIAQLYAVEKQARGQPPDKRKELRQLHAKPIFEELGSWLGHQLSRISGRSELGKVIKYARTHLPKLEQYLYDGRLEIDK